MGLLQTALSNLLNMHFDGKLCNKESVRKCMCVLYNAKVCVCLFGQTIHNDTRRLRSFMAKDKQKKFFKYTMG